MRRTVIACVALAAACSQHEGEPAEHAAPAEPLRGEVCAVARLPSHTLIGTDEGLVLCIESGDTVALPYVIVWHGIRQRRPGGERALFGVAGETGGCRYAAIWVDEDGALSPELVDVPCSCAPSDEMWLHPLADVDGDGFDDFAFVGPEIGDPVVHVLSGRDGSLLLDVRGERRGFGTAVASFRAGNGAWRLAIGSPLERAVIVTTLDGTEVDRWTRPDKGEFGARLVVPPERDRMLVGAPESSHSNADFPDPLANGSLVAVSPEKVEAHPERYSIDWGSVELVDTTTGATMWETFGTHDYAFVGVDLLVHADGNAWSVIAIAPSRDAPYVALLDATGRELAKTPLADITTPGLHHVPLGDGTCTVARGDERWAPFVVAFE